MKLFAMLIVMIAGACTLFGGTNTVSFEKYSFAVQPPKAWNVADAQIVKMFSAATHKGVVAHAKQKDSQMDASVIESEVLLIVMKHPLGAKEDNPNVTVSVEKSWSPMSQNTGATYLKLLADRFKLFKAPSRMNDEPKKEEIGGVDFYTQDAVNDRVPDATTRQQFITTYMAGYYVTFIISYNDKKDSDYQAMKAMVDSFKILKKNVQPPAGGDGKPATQP
jgi:hypothetical protein